MQPLLLSFEALERKAPALCSSTLLLGRPSHNNPFRPGHSATARSARHTLRLQAAVSPVLEERVELPLQLHRLLQVSQAANRETCKRVIEKLSCSPPAVGYTKVVCEAVCVSSIVHMHFYGALIPPGCLWLKQTWCPGNYSLTREGSEGAGTFHFGGYRKAAVLYALSCRSSFL